MTLIPGRTCGACTACCVAPAIDQPDIQKSAGVACRHCGTEGCAIYEGRPQVCRSFYCAWRTVEIFDEAWRPDRSGVLAEVETRDVPESFELATGLRLLLIGNPLKTVRQSWFQDFVATGVSSGVPLFLMLPGPPGHQAASVLLNTEQMRDAIARRQTRQALEAALKILREWRFVPSMRRNSGHDCDPPG